MQYDTKPMFGGLWGRSNAGYNGKNTPSQGTNNYNTNGAQPQSQAPYNTEYPGQNGPSPPPTYGQDAGYGRDFTAVRHLHVNLLQDVAAKRLFSDFTAVESKRRQINRSRT
jgi:hypothetical protein